MQTTPKKSFFSPLTKQPQSKSSKTPPATTSSGGRFIPHRVASNLSSAFSKAEQENSQNNTFSSLVQSQLMPDSGPNLFRYSTSMTPENKENSNFAPLLIPRQSQGAMLRSIPKLPFRVLDAPQLQDDFYLNVVDWSSSNILSVGLGENVYLWDASSNKVTPLCSFEGELVSSLSWAPSGMHLAVGTTSGKVLLYDITRNNAFRTLQGHTGRVGALSWNNWMLSSGSRDKTILHRDLRSHNNITAKLTGHKQEVCGLKWSWDGEQLASGGNDNMLVVWSAGSISPVSKFTEHNAAVKALAWSPQQNGLLVSGGGTADRTIRFWNTCTNENVFTVDTQSQVCNLMFSRNTNELVSTHGYSQHQINIWKLPSMQKTGVLMGHTSRVLYLSMSPDFETIVTGAGDETLRFWKVFPREDTESPGGCGLWPCMTEMR